MQSIKVERSYHLTLHAHTERGGIPYRRAFPVSLIAM